MASVRKWFGNIAPRLPLKPPQRTIRLAILWIHLPPLCVTLTWLPWFLHLPSHLTSRSNHLISLLPRTISRCWRGTMRSRSRGPRPRINRGWSRGINWHLLRACPSQCRKFYCVIFTDNQEIEVARWLHNNPLFYNHKLKLHKDDKKKKNTVYLKGKQGNWKWMCTGSNKGTVCIAPARFTWKLRRDPVQVWFCTCWRGKFRSRSTFV